MLYYNKSSYKIGICISVSKLAEAVNFDFAELSLSEVTDLSEIEFYLLKNNLIKYNISVPVMNCLFPRNLPIVGEKLNLEDIKKYLRKAIRRAYELECKLFVLGSGFSRTYTDTYGKIAAFNDFSNVLKILEGLTTDYNITIAIEPLCALETNLLNTMQETYDYIINCNIPGIKMICDTYHLENSAGNFRDIKKYTDLIQHFHISGKHRSFPIEFDEKFKTFFEIIDELGYEKLISIEAVLTQVDLLSISASAFSKNKN